MSHSHRHLLTKQRDFTDCGPCCLASISAYHGHHISTALIRAYAGTGAMGTSVAGILHASSRIGFDASAFRLSYESLVTLAMPAIVHCSIIERSAFTHFPAPDHYIVLVQVTGKWVKVMDPAEGRIKKLQVKQFKAVWTGIAIILTPGAKFKTSNKINIRRKAFKMIFQHKSSLWLAALCSAIASVLGLTLSIYVKYVVDEVIASHSLSFGNILAAIVLALLLLQFMITSVKNGLILKMNTEMNFKMISRYYRHLMELPASFLKNMQVGEILSRVNDGIKIIGGINDFVVNNLVHALILVISFGLMFLYNWKVAALVIAVTPVLVALFMISDFINKRYQRGVLEAGADFEAQSVELVSNVMAIRHLGAGEIFGEKTDDKLLEFLRKACGYSKKQLILQNVTEFIIKALIGILLWVGSQQVIGRQFSVGELLSFYTLLSFSSTPLLQLFNGFKTLGEVRIAATRLFDILDLEKCEYGTKKLIASSPVDVRFSHVTFGYGHGASLFKKLCVFIQPGKITGIKGKSGCGKSTLLALILKDYDVNEGTVEINGINVKDLDKDSLNQIISFAPQQPELFSGTIRENITIGSRQSFMNLEELCERLGINELASELPGGIDTTIAERGVNLSGGQRQPISLARALYRNSRLLLLDEPTASVDQISKSKIVQTIEWYKRKGNTVIIVSHSDSTLKICDNIAVLEDGVVK